MPDRKKQKTRRSSHKLHPFKWDAPDPRVKDSRKGDPSLNPPTKRQQTVRKGLHFTQPDQIFYKDPRYARHAPRATAPSASKKDPQLQEKKAARPPRPRTFDYSSSESEEDSDLKSSPSSSSSSSSSSSKKQSSRKRERELELDNNIVKEMERLNVSKEPYKPLTWKR